MENNYPKISVLVPVYNGGEFFKRCLNSLYAQTYPNFEIVIVNNNSTDDTAQTIAEAQKTHDNIVVGYEEVRKRGAARNAGLALVTGDIVAMLDSDCIAEPDWLMRLTEPIRTNRDNIVMGYQSDPIGNFWTSNIQRLYDYLFEKARVGDYIQIIDTKNFAIRAAIIKEFKFDAGLITLEDLDLMIRLIPYDRFRFLPEVVVEHHHTASCTTFVKSFFIRGYCVGQIYQKYKGVKDVRGITIYEVLPLFSYIKEFSLIPKEYFKKKALKELFFLYTGQIAWSAGAFWAYIGR